MDSIDKWLKSLRLHKYTHLFKRLTYEEMLNLEEKYLIDMEVTKGARNKMLVSVKKLNLRQERLVNMIDDLNHDNISMKEALTTLKDMLVTPIPPPRISTSLLVQKYSKGNSLSQNQQQVDMNYCSPKFTQLSDVDILQQLSIHQPLSSSNYPSPAPSSDSTSSSTMPLSYSTLSPSLSPSSSSSPTALSSTPGSVTSYSSNSLSITPTISSMNLTDHDGSSLSSLSSSNQKKQRNYLDPYELTYLFVETLDKVAQRLIESSGNEDNACHGIMAAIVDECLKHNSFTKEQKAKVAGFRPHFTKEPQKSKISNFKQHQQYQLQQLVRQRSQSHYNQVQHHNYYYPHHSYHHNQQQQQTQHHHHQYTTNHLQPHHQQQYQQLSNAASSILATTVAKATSPIGATTTTINGSYNNGCNVTINKSSSHNSPSSNNDMIISSSNDNNKNQFHLNLNHHCHLSSQRNNSLWASGSIQQPSLSASLSTIGSASISDEEERQQTYKEYSLLGPGMTFELPCLRALAATEKHNRRQLCFLSSFDRKSSC